MAPRTILIAATLLGAALVNASPRPAPLPVAFAQAGGLPQCLTDCLTEYAFAPSAMECAAGQDPSTITDEDLMILVNCWCTDSSRAGTALDACNASCSDGSDDVWTTLCSAAGGGGIPIDEPEEEEETTTLPSRPTRTTTIEEEEETDEFDFPSETEDTDSPVITDDAEESDFIDEDEPTEVVVDDEPTTTRTRRPTGTVVEQDDEEGSAQQFVPHAGALALGLVAAIVAL